MSIWQKPPLGALPLGGHPLSQGLVGYWLMNEGTGNKVYDLSGYGNDGNFVGTAPSWTVSDIGHAVSLPGTNEYIEVPYSDAFSGKRTVVVRFRIPGGYASGGGRQDIVNHRDPAGARPGIFSFMSDATGQMNFSIDIGASVTPLLSNKATWSDKQYMVVVTADGTNLTMYIDGVYDNSTAFTTAMTDAPAITLKYGTNRSASVFGTVIYSMCAIYNRALTATEVQQLYIEPFCVFERDDIVLWQSAAAPPAGGAGIMTTNTGFWGATY